VLITTSQTDCSDYFFYLKMVSQIHPNSKTLGRQAIWDWPF